MVATADNREPGPRSGMKSPRAAAFETFSTTLRDEMDLDTLNGTLVGVVRETMQPSYASLWLRPGSAPKQSEGSE